MECIILIGIPGAGKSTYYKDKFDDTHLRINIDMLVRISRESDIFKAAVKTNTKIVIDNTNTTIKDRMKYIPLLKKNKYKIIAYYFQTDLEKTIEANNKRDRVVPEKVIRTYYKNLIIPELCEGFDEVYRIENYYKYYVNYQSNSNFGYIFLDKYY